MEVVNIEVSNSSVAVRLRKSGFTVFGPHSLCCHVFLPSSSPGSLVEADLLDATALFGSRRLVPAERTLLRDLERMLSRSRTAEWRAASDLLGLEVESRRDDSLARAAILAASLGYFRGAQHVTAVVAVAVAVAAAAAAAAIAGPWLLVLKKAIPSDWNRRYRSNLREGTAGCSAERIPKWISLPLI
jgi:hypothetical protein